MKKTGWENKAGNNKKDQENVIDIVNNTHYNVFKFLTIRKCSDREEYIVTRRTERRWMV